MTDRRISPEPKDERISPEPKDGGGADSDIRLKRDVAEVGALPNGLKLYSFRYLTDDTVHVGVMAQDVLGVVPEAVRLADDGYYRVDYGKLGTRMMTLEEWRARSH